MGDTRAGDTRGGEPRYLGTKEAAAYLGLSPKTLEKLRVTGEGPPYAKAGRRVIYDRRDLDRWVAERKRRFTGGSAEGDDAVEEDDTTEEEDSVGENDPAEDEGAPASAGEDDSAGEGDAHPGDTGAGDGGDSDGDSRPGR